MKVWLSRSWMLAAAFLGGCGSPRPPDTGSVPETGVRFAERWVVTPDSVRLYARVLGTGPDTVLIPGGMYLSRDLDPLTEGRTLVFYDPRSRGASDAVFDTLRLGMDQEVRDMEAVRAAFGVGRVALLGWSYLGAVVARYAAEHPEHVRAVVQVGPMGPLPTTPPPGEARGSRPDSSDLRRLADMEAAGLPASDPVRYCRAWALTRMIRPMMGRPEAALRMKSDPCPHWNEWPGSSSPPVGGSCPPWRGAPGITPNGRAESGRRYSSYTALRTRTRR